MTCFDLAYDDTWLHGRPIGDSRLAFASTKPQGRFDLVLMLDVLEHVEDDRAALLDAVLNFLAPGGRLLVSVPAGPGLFSRHDELLGHKRRYAPARLGALVDEVGLAVVDQGQLFASLLVPRAMTKLWEMALGHDRTALSVPPHVETSLGTWKHGRLLTTSVVTALSVDALCSRLASRLRLPFAGLSTWVLAKIR